MAFDFSIDEVKSNKRAIFPSPHWGFGKDVVDWHCNTL